MSKNNYVYYKLKHASTCYIIPKSYSTESNEAVIERLQDRPVLEVAERGGWEDEQDGQPQHHDQYHVQHLVYQRLGRAQLALVDPGREPRQQLAQIVEHDQGDGDPDQGVDYQRHLAGVCPGSKVPITWNNHLDYT